MRMLLPIKGPGGRALTPREKAALLVLGFTLVVCVLTLLAGRRAFEPGEAQNPVLAMVSIPSRLLGGGIVALYGLVLVWSALVYFKGERVARIAPVGGRLVAALAMTVGISGALGLAQAATAGNLGTMVGSALGNVLGGVVGIPILLVMVLIGLSLAAQGSWAAMQQPTPRPAAPGAAPPPFTAFKGFAPSGTGFVATPSSRRVAETPLPDDGDPSSEARTLAITQGIEEIEQQKGVTILDVEKAKAAPEPILPSTPTDATPETTHEVPPEPRAELRSVGDEVAEAPPPAPGTEEATIQESLLRITESIEPAGSRYAAVPPAATPEPAEAPLADAEATYFTPSAAALRSEPAPAAPPEPAAPAEESYGAPYEPAYERGEETPVHESCSEPGEIAIVEPSSGSADAPPAESGLPVPGDPLPVSPEEPAAAIEASGPAAAAEPAFPLPPAPPEPPATPQATLFEVSEPSAAPPGDPYATPGLLRRAGRDDGAAPGETPRNSTSFDWRGRPID